MSGRPRILHPAERRYLLDAARGLTAHQSARLRGVSVNTVLGGLKRGKTTLNATNITHAVALSLAYGEFTSDDVRNRA